MTASTTERVAANTDDGINRRIARETEARLAYYRDHPEEIADRLRELENEWDVERALEANAASLALAGVAFGAMGSRVWLVLPALVASFLLQHAVQGWCPPLPVLRRIGLRTAEEIGRERYALKALRGDFDDLRQAQDRLAAVLQATGIGPRHRSPSRPS